MEKTPTRFGIAGAGWRTEFFLRVAREVPNQFVPGGVVVRDPAKREAFKARWNVPVFGSMSEMADAVSPEFVVVSVPWAASPGLLLECAARNLPALAETPPAPDVASLTQLYQAVEKGARIAVAEQYIYQPLHAARLQIARSGRLGQISHVQVSAAHGYHGISLLRHYLGVGREDVTISARKIVTPIVAGPGRNGPPTEERIADFTQTIAFFAFESGKVGVFDFTGDQYFSWIRGPRVLVRGERGEIDNETVRYLADFRTPIEARLLRRDTGQGGNLEGYAHTGYLMGESWAYRNPFPGARLSDDELAIASGLSGMAQYARGDDAANPYSLAEAAHDRYLDILLTKALETGEPVISEKQAWMT